MLCNIADLYSATVSSAAARWGQNTSALHPPLPLAPADSARCSGTCLNADKHLSLLVDKGCVSSGVDEAARAGSGAAGRHSRHDC